MSGARRAMLQDNVPQARIYKVWNIPGYQAARLHAARHRRATCSAGGKNSRLYKRLVYTDRTATAVHGVRRPVRDRLAAAAHRHREARRAIRPWSRRRSTRSWRSFLATGPTPAELERIRTTNYANFARGIERIDGFGGKSSDPRRKPGVRRLAGFLQDAARLDLAGATPADVQAAAQALAVRRRVRAQRRSRRRRTRPSPPRRSQQAARHRHAAVAQAARAAAREAVQWPAVGGGRAAQRARGRFHADRRCRLRGGQPGQARHGAARHADAAGRHEDPQLARDLRARRIPRRNARRRLFARSFVPQHERAVRTGSASRSSCTPTCC